jgi:KaiC/GvpD/RAD55 family RecA-like ATPase
MVTKLEEITQNPNLLLIEGPSGAGKTLLSLKFVLEAAKMGKRCFFVSLLPTKNLIEGAKTFFPDLSELFGKKVFFGYVEPRTEEELLEDVEYVLKSFAPKCIVIDPLLPDMDTFIFKEICDMLRMCKITGIFCSAIAHELEPFVDFVIEIKMARIKDKIQRELILRSKNPSEEKHYNLQISENSLTIEPSRKVSYE